MSTIPTDVFIPGLTGDEPTPAPRPPLVVPGVVVREITPAAMQAAQGFFRNPGQGRRVLPSGGPQLNRLLSSPRGQQMAGFLRGIGLDPTNPNFGDKVKELQTFLQSNGISVGPHGPDKRLGPDTFAGIEQAIQRGLLPRQENAPTAIGPAVVVPGLGPVAGTAPATGPATRVADGVPRDVRIPGIN